MILPLLLGVLFQCGKPDAEREANRLFVEAYQHIDAAGKLEGHDPAEAHIHYRLALEKIEQIINNYSDSQIAVDVAQHRTRIGDLTIGDLRRKVPSYAARAEALESFHKLTLYAIGMEDNVLDKGLFELDYAGLLTRNPRDLHHDELVRMVESRADRHWDREVTDRLYFELSVHFSEIARWPRSLKNADRIQNPELLYESLKQIVLFGYITDELDPRALEQFYSYIPYLNPVDQVRIIELICKELFTSGRGAQAVALVRERLPSPDDDHALEHIEMLTDLSNTLADHGEFVLSRQIVRQIGNIDSNYTDFALRYLAVQLGLHDKMDEALKIVEGFNRDYFEHTTLAALAVRQAKRDSIDHALNLLGQIPDNVSEKTESLLEIAWIVSDNEALADSLILLGSAGIGGMTSSLQRSYAYLRIADIQIRHDKRSLAAQAIENAESDAHDVAGAEAHNQLIAEIIERWISLGRPDRALDIAAWFQMSDPSFNSLVSELYAFAIARGYHDFARSLAGMSDRRPYYQFILIETYLDNGMISQPSELAYDIRNYYWRTRALGRLSTDLKIKVNNAAAEKAATDALLTMQRIRDIDERQQALIRVSALLSAGNITMNEERRALALDVLNSFEI